MPFRSTFFRDIGNLFFDENFAKPGPVKLAPFAFKPLFAFIRVHLRFQLFF